MSFKTIKNIFKTAMTIFAVLILTSCVLSVYSLRPTRDIFILGAICGVSGFLYLVLIVYYEAIRRCFDRLDELPTRFICGAPQTPPPSLPASSSTSPHKRPNNDEVQISMDETGHVDQSGKTQEVPIGGPSSSNVVLSPTVRSNVFWPWVWSPIPVQEQQIQPPSPRTSTPVHDSPLHPLEWKTSRIVARMVLEGLLERIDDKYLEHAVKLEPVDENDTRIMSAREYFERRIKPIRRDIFTNLLEVLRARHDASMYITDADICELLNVWIKVFGDKKVGFDNTASMNSTTQYLSSSTADSGMCCEESSGLTRSKSMDELLACATVLDDEFVPRKRTQRITM